MATTFNFGIAEIPAHRHVNPDGSLGGWVCDASHVSADSHVQDGCTVEASTVLASNLLAGSLIQHSRVSDSAITGSLINASHVCESRVRGRTVDGCVMLRNLDHHEAAQADVESVLAEHPHEVRGVLGALRTGRVDGSTYTGDCSCLIGIVAKLRGTPIRTMRRDVCRPAEQWFMMLRKGDTPETSAVCCLTVEWVERWLSKQHESV